MLFSKKISTFAPLKRRETRKEYGRMAEWSNAAVLKTVDLHGSGGSNPSSSAKAGAILRLFCFWKKMNSNPRTQKVNRNLFLICYANTLIPFAMARVLFRVRQP